MNPCSDPQWSHQEPADPGASLLAEDDFANFIDLDNMDLSFPIYDNSGMEIQQDHQLPLQDQNAPFSGNSPSFDLDPFGDMSSMDPAAEYSSTLQMLQGGTNAIDFTSSSSYQPVNDNFQGALTQTYPIHYNVPPTPNSTEMYPSNMLYAPQQMENHGQWSSEQQFQMRKDDVMASLTPLISPHLPGNAHNFHVHPGYTMPGAYLSPLSSPAIVPQLSAGQYLGWTPTTTADSSLAGSPIDLTIEPDNTTAVLSDERPHKARRTTASTKTSASVTRTRKQNTTNQRRRGSLTTLIPIARATTGAQHSPIPGTTQSQVPHAQGQPSSKFNSPLSRPETLMGPPPRPGSVINTPTGPVLDHVPGQPPATPASLMRLRQQQQSDGTDLSPSLGQNSMSSPVTRALGASMEDLRLPEAASIPNDNSHNTPRIIMSEPINVTNTPSTVAMCRTPGFQAILPSPAVSINGSKTENKGGRGSKKRGNTNSSLVSPAILPKISPSLHPKPSNSAKTLSTDTQVLLLASKSNYQNIIEGTTLPGVNYPAELSTNLTLKRTSHKLAEQGRRNRMNVGLQELQTLLPTSPAFPAQARREDGTLSDADAPTSTSPEEGHPGPGGAAKAATTDTGEACASSTAAKANSSAATAANQANSKAATVELAIDYIKHLTSTLADQEGENERLRAELRAMQENSCTAASVDKQGVGVEGKA